MFVKVNGVFPQDPRLLLKEFSRMGWDTSVWRNKVNAFHYLRGTSPSVGYFLLMFDELTDSPISIEINTTYTPPGEKKATASEDDLITIQGLEVSEVEAINPIENPEKAIYLVTVIDPVVNKWSYTYVKKDFNIPTGVEDGNTIYDEDTINGDDPYTWQELFNEVSGETIDTSNASFPMIGSPPTESIPEGFKFKSNSRNLQMSRKEGLDWLTLVLGHTLIRKPDATFELVPIDTTDVNDQLAGTVQTDNLRGKFLRFDSHKQLLGQGAKIPEKINFIFPKIGFGEGEDQELTIKQRDIDTGSPTTSTVPFVPGFEWDIEAPLYDNRSNEADLDLVADHLITIYRTAIKGLYSELQELELLTYINLTPDKGISKVIWFYNGDNDGPRTYISSDPGIEFRPQRVPFSIGISDTKIEGVMALIKGRIPAADGIDLAGPLIEINMPPGECLGKVVLNPGLLSQRPGTTPFTALTNFEAGALIIELHRFSGAQEGELEARAQVEMISNGVGEQLCSLVLASVLNPAYTDFVAEDQEIAVFGTLITTTTDDGTETRSFILPWPDLRAMPGYLKGSDEILDAQAPFHEGGADDFKLDRNDCG